MLTVATFTIALSLTFVVNSDLTGALAHSGSISSLLIVQNRWEMAYMD